MKNRYRKWLHCLAPLGAAVLLWQMVSGGETVLPQMITYAAPGYDQAASSSSEKAIGKYGMTPIYAADIQDGTYEVKVESSSSFFRIQSARLTVKDGTMQAVLTMDSSSYLYAYPGTAGGAAAAPLEDYLPMEEQEEGTVFTIPVSALNQETDCAAFSKKREKWYDRKLLFDASSLPQEAFSFAIPDYDRIEKAIKLYDKTKGTDTKAELAGEAAEEETEASVQAQAKPVSMEEDDGEYSIEVSMTGGSERASVTSPTWLYVRNGKGYAKLLWSSVYYDYMIVGGETYRNETTDGSNSTFTIPITALDEPVNVIADTTAMGEPVEIEYALTFYSDTVGATENIPQEAAKKVLIIALVIIAVGGILNYLVKKRRN
ncbi:MAG: hypothetical protein PHR92_12760 [Lachnospiraceae bacterium]|nr:hypothetical protein [Lachnospiraceae bacterium]